MTLQDPLATVRWTSFLLPLSTSSLEAQQAFPQFLGEIGLAENEDGFINGGHFIADKVINEGTSD